MSKGVDDIGFIESVAKEAGVELPDYYKARSGNLSERMFQPELAELQKRIKEFLKENPDTQVVSASKDSIKRIA